MINSTQETVLQLSVNSSLENKEQSNALWVEWTMFDTAMNNNDTHSIKRGGNAEVAGKESYYCEWN